MFKNDAQIWKALLAGKKLTKKKWTNILYIHLIGGDLVTDDGRRVFIDDETEFEVYKEK